MRPFDGAELADLFSPLETSRGLVIAVSGGSDSTALMHLIARWRGDGHADLPILIATIDHGLRPDAAAEAHDVATAAAALGFPHRTLVWQGDKPHSNLQDAARTARYDLLQTAARDVGADTIVTAHTQDDQAETFLLALQRGSGVYGLAGMRPARRLGAFRLVRPLMAVSRQRLRASLLAEKIDWIDDPSNSNERFARVRIRQNAAALSALGLSLAGLAETAARMARAADALESAIDRLVARSCTIHFGGIIRLELAVFSGAPAEIRLRTMARLLCGLSGDPYPPRFERLERFLAAFEADAEGQGDAVQRTLSGVTARRLPSSDRGSLILFREAGRSGFPTVAIGPDETVEWDRRIHLRLSRQAPRLVLGALGPGARRHLAAPEARGLPAAALATLPALKSMEGKPIAIFGWETAAPAIDFALGTASSQVIERLQPDETADRSREPRIPAPIANQMPK